MKLSSAVCLLVILAVILPDYAESKRNKKKNHLNRKLKVDLQLRKGPEGQEKRCYKPNKSVRRNTKNVKTINVDPVHVTEGKPLVPEKVVGTTGIKFSKKLESAEITLQSMGKSSEEDLSSQFSDLDYDFGGLGPKIMWPWLMELPINRPKVPSKSPEDFVFELLNRESSEDEVTYVYKATLKAENDTTPSNAPDMSQFHMTRTSMSGSGTANFTGVVVKNLLAVDDYLRRAIARSELSESDEEASSQNLLGAFFAGQKDPSCTFSHPPAHVVGLLDSEEENDLKVVDNSTLDSGFVTVSGRWNHCPVHNQPLLVGVEPMELVLALAEPMADLEPNVTLVMNGTPILVMFQQSCVHGHLANTGITLIL